MLMNMMNGGSTSFNGLADQETSSLCYDGTLLPVGNTNRLKNKGKDGSSANLLVQSGQGKMFNGTSQCVGTLWSTIGFTGVKSQFTISMRITASNANYAFNSGYESGAQGCSLKTGSGNIQFFTNLDNEAGLSIPTKANGTSYMLSVTFNNGVVTGYVDGVNVASKTFLNSTIEFLGTQNLSLGAYRLSSGYFNGIIQDVSIYKVPLTQEQITKLYQYPEAITNNTAGGIVPDIGNVDDCVFYAPMSESSNVNTYVVDISKARSVEILANTGFDTDTAWTKQAGVTISGGTLNFNTASNNIQAYQQTTSNGTVYGTIKPNTKYLVTYTISSYTSGYVNVIVGGSSTTSNKNALGTYSQIIDSTASPVNFIYLTSTYGGTGFVGSIDNISVKEITAMPIASFTASCVDNAKQLADGQQYIALKRDALGIVTGKEIGLHFDGNKSIKWVNTGWIPSHTSSFIVEMIKYKESTAVKLSGVNSMELVSIGQVNSTLCVRLGSTSLNYSASNGYRHFLMDVNTEAMKVNVYIDGVKVGDNITITGLDSSSVIPFTIAAENAASPTYYETNNIPLLRIHKGTQYAKFDITKAWANASKIIATLGA